MAEKLSWVEINKGRSARADTEYGRYIVHNLTDEFCIELVCMDDHKFELWINKVEEHMPTIDEGKAAAQRDYELRCDAEAGRLAEQTEQVCEWRATKPYDDSYWETQCGNAWCFDDEDGRLARDAVFCPNCGKRVEYVEEAHPQPLPEGGE